jgi:uncharacterized protein (TIGR03067 family)
MIAAAMIMCSQVLLSQTDADSRDLKQMQGIWVPTEWIHRGKVMPQESLKSISLVIKDNKYHHGDVTNQPPTQEFGINANRSPKEIDLANVNITINQRTYIHGIYELNQDRLVIFLKSRSPSRPTGTGRGEWDIKWTFELKK